MKLLLLVVVSVLTLLSSAAPTRKDPIREHPHSVEVSEGQWANFSCGFKLPGSIQWRIGDFTRGDGSLYSAAVKLPQVEGVTAEKSFQAELKENEKFTNETIGVLATAEMDGVPVQCMYKSLDDDPVKNSFSEYAIIHVNSFGSGN